MSCRSDSLAVAILAGGEGLRIGGGKPLRMLGGLRLIDHVLANARNWSDDVLVAARAEEQLGGINARFVADAPGAGGPIAGLAAALAYAWRAGHGLVLTIPCDTPFLPIDLPERLREGLSQDAGAAVAESLGRLHPSCALWRAHTFRALGPYLATGRASLLGFAEVVGFNRVAWPTDAFDPFFNVNTRQDLVEAERMKTP